MSSSIWTLEDLAALEAAIGKGLLEVKYTDKRVIFRSLKEMLTIRSLMRKKLGCELKSGRLLVETSKGLDC